MKIYHLTIEEIEDYGNYYCGGGDSEENKIVHNRIVLDEMFLNIELVKEQLNSIKEFKLTFDEKTVAFHEKPSRGEDDDVFSDFLVPTVEELTSNPYVEVDVIRKENDFMSTYSWFNHFFRFTLKEYDLKENIIEGVR